MLLSAQNTINGVLKFKVSNKHLGFELGFNSRPHPFKMFEEFELQNLTNADKAKYRECLIKSKNNIALAYYLFKNNYLSRSLRAAGKSCLVNLFKHMGTLNPKCLKEYFTVKLKIHNVAIQI